MCLTYSVRHKILDGVIGNTSVFDTEIAGSNPAPITI